MCRHRFAGGAPLLVRCDIGAGCTAPTMVDGRTLSGLGTPIPARPHMRQFPVNGTTLVNVDDNYHYRMAGNAPLPPSATAIVDRRTISSPLAGLISDPQAELVRLRKRKAKVEQDLKKEEAKFANPNFVANAKPEVVALGHERIAEFKRQIAQLEDQEKSVGDL